jgi:raffinose/stachyose/melibiose transport system substrate-binding protein
MKNMRKLTVLFLVLFVSFTLFACKKDPIVVEPVEIQVTSVQIQGSSNMTIGSTVNYSAILLPDNATNISVSWQVISRGGEATVDSFGLVTATKAGAITLRATAQNGLYAEKSIAILNISIPIQSVIIEGLSTINHGERQTYSITVSPQNATYSNIEWSVLEPSKGKVDASGRLAARTSGELTLQVRVDGVTATKSIYVEPYTGSVSNVRVLLNRVDLRQTVLRDYEREFEALYPMYNVVFETLLDYENNARMRLMGGDYGDVLLIPSSVSAQNLSYYFTPIGQQANLENAWRYVGQKSYNGVVYGLPTYGNVNGILYNKKVFNQVGIDEIPATPEAFLQALQLIKAHYQNQSSFIAPFYSNKKDSWPLDQWQGNVSSVSGDPNYYYNVLPLDRQAFTQGSPHYIVYKLLYDIVYNKLTEADPSTTNWERSKVEFVKGNIGTMIVGSWAVSQFTDVARDVRDGTFQYDDGTPGEQSNLANPLDVGYMPFPYTHPDGNMYAAHTPDFFMGISNRTSNAVGANDFLLWFLRESGYYELVGGIPPRQDMPFPAVIQAFEELGVVLFEELAATQNMVGKLDLVEANSGIVLWNPDWKRDLFEDAFFQRKTYDQIMSDLNTSWNIGINTIT